MGNNEFKFINPYNFIPFANAKTPASKSDDEEKLSGVIEYSLLTKTPLFIPNTSCECAIDPVNYNEKEHKSYEFFAYEDLTSFNDNLKKLKEEQKNPEELQLQKKTKDNLLAPVIPGSEIRGVLRANYEILTNSCMSAFDGDVTLGRRSAEVFQAGLLKKNDNADPKKVTYDLYAANDTLLRTKGKNSLVVDLDWKDDNDHNGRKCYVQKDVEEGQLVYVKTQNRNGKPLVTSVYLNQALRAMPGYVLKGADGPDMTDKKTNKIPKNQKHCCHIFIPNGRCVQKNIDEKRLDKLLDIYKENLDENAEITYAEYQKNWNAFKKGDEKFKEKNGGEYFPVYYSVIKDGNTPVYYLSPASITREMSVHKLNEFAKKYTSCTNKQDMCMTCSLFGMLSDKTSVASRVRMTDMTVDFGGTNFADLYENPITLQELSGPKLQNVEFYLKRQANAWLWTYDYYVDRTGNVHTYSAELNGRKFYWHNPGMKLADAKANEINNRNVTVRPVKKDVVFHGKLFFDGITKQELNSLIYLINAGEDCDTALAAKKHGYKLGHAKPLGFGSVALHADCVKLRTLEKDENNKCVTYNVGKYDLSNEEEFGADYEKNFGKKLKDDFDKMTDFYALDGVLKNTTNKENTSKGEYEYSYPHKENKEDEVFNWFVGNHKGYRNKDNIRTNIDMPNKRNFQYFDQYMKPMEPVLQSTGASKEMAKGNSQGNNPGGNQKSKGKPNNGSKPNRNGKQAWSNGSDNKNQKKGQKNQNHSDEGFSNNIFAQFDIQLKK